MYVMNFIKSYQCVFPMSSLMSVLYGVLWAPYDLSHYPFKNWNRIRIQNESK